MPSGDTVEMRNWAIRAAYKDRSRDAMDKLIASHAIALEVPLVGDKQFYANSRSTTHAIDDRRRNGTDDQAVTALKALAREVLFEHLPHCSLASMDIGGHGRLG